MQNRDEGLRREIGVWGLSANIINIIIGAGIFVLPAIVAAGLGTSAVLAYLLCGLLVTLIMLCFAEAGSKITTSGGAYSYIEEAFGKYAGFITAFLFLIATISADAAVANALADILSSVWPVFDHGLVRACFFLVIFGGLAYINVIGVKEGIGLVKINTIAKLTPLLILVALGWSAFAPGNLDWDGMPGIDTLGEVSLVLFFAFQGAESALTVGGEVRNPARTIPRSILIAVTAIVVLYILIQMTCQGILGAELPEASDAPLSQAAERILGPAGFVLMTVGAAISMFGNLSGEVLSIPRIAYRAALDNVIPVKALAKVHQRFATPYVAIIAYAAIDFLLATIGGFKQLAIISSAAMLLIYFGVAMSVIRFRQMNVREGGAFRIPGGLFVPVAAMATIIWLLSNLTGREMIGAIVFIGALSIAYFAIREFGRKR